MRLLIHHHAVAHVNSDGIWIHSTIGKWISQLSKYFQNVGLLVHVSENRMPVQDTCITNENVVLHSLGAPGIMWDKIKRTSRIKRVCCELDNQYDFLLIRGITPRQHVIWNEIKVKTLKKYFLLVGSPNYNLILSKLHSFSEMYHWYMERLRRMELKFILKNGSLIVNAPNLQKEAKIVFNVVADFVPTNTISIKEFLTFKVRKVINPIRLLFCGRIEIKKGIIEAINAVNILINGGYQVKLDLIGPFVDDKFYTEAKTLINKLNINKQVIFHDRIPYGEKLFQYFEKSDIFILPSYTEGFPHVIWESAANCCPIITTSVGGIPSLFKHQQHGILIPAKDHQALADSIIELITNKSLRTKIVTNAYNLAQEYTAESCAKKLAEVILSENEKHS
ncbi:MAG: glycosyltransferase family 4 protein [Bacteroidetes bacterium]|nr:glycosyltransferase family 4 protein [Bacteroidota bacterium]